VAQRTRNINLLFLHNFFDAAREFKRSQPVSPEYRAGAKAAVSWP